MNLRQALRRSWRHAPVGAMVAALLTTAALSGCGGGGGDDAGASLPAAPPQITRVGVAGGSAAGPDGSSAEVPAGALTQDVDIGIAASDAGAPPLPADVSRIGTIYAFTPHGTTFAQPVSVTVPFDPAQLPAGSSPALYKTTAGRAGWAEVPGAVVDGAAMVGSVTGFSNLVVVIPPLIKADPRYEWEFGVYTGNSLGAFIPPQGSGEQVGGVLSELADVGPQPLDLILPLLGQTLPKDGRANGHVFAQGNGVTYGTQAEAPFGALDTADPIGSRARLKQWQSFRKESDDATLTFTLTSVVLRLEDYGPALNRRGERLQAEAMLSVGAYLGTDRSKYFYYRGGRVTAWGERGEWDYRAPNFSFSRGALWDDSLFEQTVEPIAYSSENETCVGELVRVRFKQPRTYSIDLSSVPTGAEFTVRADVETAAMNAKGRDSIADCLGSHAYAYLRDPQEVGGPMIEYTGLLPTPTPSIESPPRDAYEPPVSCPAGTLPAAGTLQFSTGFFAINEAAGTAPSILVTRTGGSTGAVSATFATVGGTAVAGVDYQTVLTTVHFGDGDSGTRVVEVPIIPNNRDETNRTVLFALSEPGGCAALGVPSSGVLTIEDDEEGAGPPPGTLDDSFGASGRATLPRFGGENSAMALQPDGRILMAGGTFDDFVLARFNADGSVDTSFGGLGTGTVETDIAGGAQQEQARAIAVQSDGRIVVAGEARPAGGGQELRMALVRYNSDGSLDATFGNGGKVFATSAVGRIFAIALEPDGRIVVAGDVPRPGVGDDFGDVMIARYLPNGVLDPSFGTGGRTEVDITGTTDLGRNLLRLPDGSYVVSGDSIGAFSEPTAVARFTSSGQLDTGFGQQGKLAIPGMLVGQGLALQSDGKLLLAGSVGAGSAARFAVLRLNADGSTDTSFGTAGLVSVTIAGNNERARSVAVQADGRIVVAGGSGAAARNFAVARLLPDGSLDTSFVGTGSVAVDFFQARDEAERVLIQPDGRILLGGWARDLSNVLGYALARLNP
jgi:uncharacterized delta-60 repeat protein